MSIVSKLTHKEFTEKAVKNLRREGYKGIHSVFSGFNAAFREYFDTDPIEATQAMAKKEHITIRPARKGCMIYLHGESPKLESSGKAVLAKMGL